MLSTKLVVGGDIERPEVMDAATYSQVVSDTYTLKILADTFINSKSAQEISIKHDIPIAACYRRVNTLESLGLLECVERALTMKGKRVKKYKSCIRNIQLFFDKGKMKMVIDLTNKPPVNYAWDVLKPEEIEIVAPADKYKAVPRFNS